MNTKLVDVYSVQQVTSSGSAMSVYSILWSLGYGMDIMHAIWVPHQFTTFRPLVRLRSLSEESIWALLLFLQFFIFHVAITVKYTIWIAWELYMNFDTTMENLLHLKCECEMWVRVDITLSFLKFSNQFTNMNENLPVIRLAMFDPETQARMSRCQYRKKVSKILAYRQKCITWKVYVPEL